MSLNVDLLKETFQRAATENGGATGLGMSFYKRLFEKYPQVRPLFHTPPEEQHKKLMASVGAIVASVTSPDKLLPYLRAMGIRHLKYGTESAHYPAVAENLLAVLGAHLSVEGDWTPEMQSTWEAAMDTVNGVMIEAAEHPEKFAEELAQKGYQPDGFIAGNDQPWVMAA